jgi:hypothetical protein
MNQIIFQVGCNNCQDEVRDFVFKNQENIGKFIVIDALPKSISTAKEVYKDLGEKLIPIICAVGTRNGIIPFFFPESEEGSAHASASLEHVFQHLHKKVYSLYSPLIDINDIFASLKLTKIDRLYLDMEGWDAETILHLDFSKVEIPFIEFEFTHSDGTFSTGENLNKVIKKLETLGYSIFRSSEYNLTATK